MTIAILAEASMKAEFCNRAFPAEVELVFADSIRSLGIIEADAYFDLEFVNDAERKRKLGMLLPRPVIVNAVAETCGELGFPFIRINAWPTFLKRPIAEISALPEMSERSLALFAALQWQAEWVPDQPGLVSPRIVAGIINEAFHALGEGVSSEPEIDMAMKLGTNYPFGPFEWLKLIGRERIFGLLHKLGQTDERYQMAPLANSFLL